MTFSLFAFVSCCATYSLSGRIRAEPLCVTEPTILALVREFTMLAAAPRLVVVPTHPLWAVTG